MTYEVLAIDLNKSTVVVKNLTTEEVTSTSIPRRNLNDLSVGDEVTLDGRFYVKVLPSPSVETLVEPETVD